MWSLYQIKEEDYGNTLGENLFSYAGQPLNPLIFSNKKTQEDVVVEILKAIEQGNKIIFIKGTCGSGKSAIALNLARHFKKTSIVVPIKSLQDQYEKDYTKNKFILKKDKQKLKISVIKGRNNFTCPFTGEKADNEQLPCTIEIREKNLENIKKYLKQNPLVNEKDFLSISDVRRMSVAPACPYWSPLLPTEVSSKALEKAQKKTYKSIAGIDFSLFQRKKGCGYWDQYESYVESDVLIFNSQKYILEILLDRKPKTDLDIIDECDQFLDNFANQRKINLNRLVLSLSNLFPDNKKDQQTIKQLIFQTNELLLNPETEVEKIKNTPVIDLIQKILSNPYLAEDEETNYYNNVFETTKNFQHLLDETYISFDIVMPDDKTREQTTYINLVTINLAQQLKEIIDRNNILILMSGTLHSEQVLKDIFRLEDFKTIEAETRLPGTIIKYRTGLEKNCKYPNFKSGLVTREQYLKALSTCLANATPPVLIHVNAFKDLPTEIEKAEYKLDNLISQEKLKQIQKSQTHVDKFKQGHIDILFTTKCARGVDFPGEKCNSIILTKYPYPNIQSLFWKILRQEQPEKFTEFYLDKAKRELIQKIMRGVRFEGDHVLLLSPDLRVLNARIS